MILPGEGTMGKEFGVIAVGGYNATGVRAYRGRSNCTRKAREWKGGRCIADMTSWGWRFLFSVIVARQEK